MSEPEAPRVVLMHPARLVRVLSIEVLDHVTVAITECDTLSGRERRRLVVDLRRPEETAVAGLLVGLGYLHLEQLDGILRVIGHDGALGGLDARARQVVEALVAVKAGMDEHLAWDEGDA